jgi:exopolyphosphatase/guanosine-5'-triphosphate,3'-diphosphate pyrophosphatase
VTAASAPVTIAALDVGTNSVLMLVARAAMDGTVTPLADLAEVTRLGRGVERTGSLDLESSARTLATLERFIGVARDLGAERIVTAATSALRDARDGAAFIEKLQRSAGVTLQIISGELEAQLNYLAAARDPKTGAEHPLLIVDIGGGSTELIASQPGAPLRVASLQIGSVRLTERLIKHDPPSAQERKQVEEAIEREIAALGWQDFKPRRLVGVAGTVTTICALALGLAQYDSGRVHGAWLERAQVDAVTERLFSLTTAERRRLPTMLAGRADVICAGAVILSRTIARFDQAGVIVSDRGVRWGLLYRELSRLGY